MLAGREEEIVFLRNRRGRDITRFYPEICAALQALPPFTGIDAVIPCEGSDHPVDRLQMTDAEIARSAAASPCRLVGHDLLFAGGRDLRSTTLGGRLQALRLLQQASANVFHVAPVRERCAKDAATGDAAADVDLLAKLKASPYPGRPTRHWRMRPGQDRLILVVGGYIRESGGLTLLCGVFREKRLELAVDVPVPSPFRSATLSRLRPLTRRYAQFSEPPEWRLGTFWTSPEMAVELRGWKFVRLRPDLCPTDIQAWQGRPPGRTGARRRQDEGIRLQRRLSFTA